jgi:signal transduction histidine kinase
MGLFRSLVYKALSVSIRTKIMGIVAACILMSALALVWYAYRDVSVALRHELQQRGIAIGTSLAAQSRDFILTDNLFALYRLIKDTRSADSDIAYIFLLNSTGNVSVHSFDNGFPTDLLGKNIVPIGQPYHFQLLLSNECTTIQDVAIPILGGQAGIIRLGISEVSINAVMSEYIRNVLIWVILILALGLSIAYGLAIVLTEPVSQLAEAARAVGKGDFFKWKNPVWAKDEIGTLGIAFYEMNEELKHKEQLRTQLLARVISAQEEERKRIARELHDETGQALTSLIVGLKFIEDSAEIIQVRKKTAELRTLTVQTLGDVHHLATELRPSILDDIGLVAAIQRYTKDYSAKMNVPVDTQVTGFMTQRLPPEVEVTAYRVIQEALTNIAKHAEANNVSVVLRYENSLLAVVIEDDGKGFDVDSVLNRENGDRLGIFGMYERASLIGGDLIIESQPGAGTTIFLQIPLKSAEEMSDEQNKTAPG